MFPTSQDIQPRLDTSHEFWITAKPRPMQRARMILRFHNRKMAADPHSLEHELCACVVLGLLYGGGVRMINNLAKRTRASWSPSR